MIVEFNQWFETNKDWLNEKFLAIELKHRLEPLHAATAYLESKIYVASITIWETGSVDAHVVSRETGQSVHAQRWDLKITEEMLSVLRDFCEKLAAESF